MLEYVATREDAWGTTWVGADGHGYRLSVPDGADDAWEPHEEPGDGRDWFRSTDPLPPPAEGEAAEDAGR